VVEIKTTRTTECDSRNDICQRKHIQNWKQTTVFCQYRALRNNETIVTQDIMTPY
jgi:hypothetical protein